MFGDNCAICKQAQEDFTCGQCGQYICAECGMNRTFQCDDCGEYGMCKECAIPENHDCPELEEK